MTTCWVKLLWVQLGQAQIKHGTIFFFFVLRPLSAQYPMTGLSALQLCGVRDRHSPSLGLSGHEVRGFCRLQRVRRGCVR